MLDTFYDAMERLQKDTADQLFKVLEKQKDYIQCTDMIYLYEYELYRLRYLCSPTGCRNLTKPQP
ncbi:hypothetical protein [Fictibacillus sp. NRS-1165]|uniref:hypothetical protein n=1 Tax=Fictibacillus sp. NRS-1165 TaxID=3144463 RepID=UPI003D20E3BC